MKLEGLRVLDLSAFLPGPHLTMMMADHGADVIMIEAPNGVGEPTRAIGEKTVDGISVWFRNIARGKRSLKLNLKDEDARALFLTLADRADVVVEAYRPGVAERLGVGHAALRARNPGLVYCSISAFGQEGPLARKPAHALAVEALAGVLDLNRGLEDDKPTNPCMPAADITASLLALSAILMALYRREKTGRGDYIDMAMYDALLAWTANVAGPVFAHGAAPVAKHMRSFGGAAMNRVYEASDGRFLVLGGAELHFARTLLEALGRPDLVPYAAQAPGPAQDPLKRELEAIFRTRSLAEWEAFLGPLDLGWAPVRGLNEALLEPYAQERGIVQADGEGARHLGPPIRFAEEPASPRWAVPAYGAHAREIAAEAGLDAAAAEALIARGVL